LLRSDRDAAKRMIAISEMRTKEHAAGGADHSALAGISGRLVDLNEVRAEPFYAHGALLAEAIRPVAKQQARGVMCPAGPIC
jgi:hypothetical protein